MAVPALDAQTGNVVISTNTTFATGTYNLTSLSVEGGATLIIGGGSTVTVSGAVLVTGNSNVVLQSINNATEVNSAWIGSGVTLNAGSVQVDSGSSINADGQGYLVNAGPGGAAVGSSNGGSYGGLGGTGYGSSTAAAIYGSNTMPTDLGSGGGSRCCGTTGGTGGGAVRLIVNGTLTNNGIISANGGNEVGFQAGGGAAGSVWVTTAGLAGSGSFTANGGAGGEAAGGGGRIAVYYNAPTSTFTGFSTSTSNGGSCGSQCSNAASTGAVGTAGFFDTSSANDNLMVDQDLTIPAGTTVSYNSITVQPDAVLTIGGGSKVTVAGTMTVSGTVIAQSINNATQVNGTWQGSGVALKAASVLVKAGGSINADGQGYVGNAGPGGAPVNSSDGGSYGGLGGLGYGSSTVGPIYGSTTAPTDLGSGGGSRCCSTTPGAGGGSIAIDVSGTLTNNGIISANGADGIGFQVGGGSGGTVFIQTGALAGSGSVAANGGVGGEAGGGGGRVALYYNTNNGFNPALITSNGGTSSNGGAGASGTVYTLGSGSNLTVSDNTVLPANANLNFNNVTVNNGATLTVGSGTTLASHTVTVTAGSDFTIGGGSTLNVSSAFVVSGNSNVVLQSINNATEVNSAWIGSGVTLNAGSVQVDSGSSINADGQGYLVNAGPGGAAVGSSNGGSYGGLGGTGYGSSTAAAIYGSNTMPTDLGSGGGSRCCGTTGGTGGGAVRLIVNGTLTNNGIISANGGNEVGLQAGGGAAGSVWVTTAGLAGSGSFTANGGAGGEAAGGGGRIAVYYNAPTSTFTGFSTSTSNGGSCGSQCSNAASTGAVGTAGFFDTSSANDNLMVDQDLTIPAGTTVSYNSITVQPDAVLTIGGGSKVTVAGTMTVSGTVIAQSINNATQVNGTWQGSGVVLNATLMVVNAGGSINADGQGYVGNAGPGGAPVNSSDGGSYGGLGGLGYGSSTVGPIYGSTTAPTDLGSGGGSRCCSTTPGAGGGALTINVTQTLTDNGIISANGGNATGLQVGGGSGGTVAIHTGTIAGSGTITATGGTGGEAGGGGGRAALYFATNSGFNIANATAAGGTASSGNAGASGTVYALGAGSNLTVSFNTVLPANANLTYSSVLVNNQGSLTLGSGTTMGAATLSVTAAGTLTIGGGSTVTVSGAVLVTGNSNVVLQSINNATEVNSAWIGSGVTLNAGSVQVDSGSSINADGQGYLVNAGPGGAAVGSSNGGSYGGLGGTGYGSSTAAAIYGSNTMPTDLGSGGGSRCCGTTGGTGGGAVRLIVNGTLTNNGIISANGGNEVGLQAGGGAAGSVWVTTAGLAGSGSFTANGGAGGEAAGGGGRIAVYYNAPTSTFTGFSTSTSNGGSCGSQCSNAASTGAVGTAGFFDTSSANDNLMVDQDLTIPAGTTVSYNSITVQPDAVLTIGGGSKVTVAGTMTVSGTVIAQSINNATQVNGTWQGSGVALKAASVLVKAGGSINADGQGYVGNAGPGGAPVNSSDGGSYGGLGGLGYGSSTVGPIYGSTTAPTDLGSGGGSRCCSTTPGAGGGSIAIDVSGTLTNNGIISANGAPDVGLQAGGGSGGSLYVTTVALSGSGAFTANGGGGGEASGGGGRVALYYDAPSSNFTGFSASTTSRGSCGTQCANATSSVGSNGTAAFFDTSATYNNVAVYQNFTIPAGTSPTYNSVTIEPGALLTIGGGATLTLTNALSVGGTVVAQSANNTAQVDGSWAGTGVSINAGSITVSSTGSLNADAQGYVGGAGPGGSPANTSAGGSYGGLGGVGDGASPAPTYGSKMLPVDLGSGGNSRCCSTIPGSGGGDLFLTVSGTLTDNGVISANGGDGIGLQVGGGSGGSLSIHTPALTGTGTIAAGGGAGGEAGGGGGRVALYFNSAAGFNLASATAIGGNSSSGSPGAVGTVYIPGALVLTVPSSTTLAASTTQLALGQSVSFQAIVTAGAGGPTPTGKVSFFDGTTLIGTQTLVAAQQSGMAIAQFQTTALAAGTHAVTAIYSGDTNVAASTSAVQTLSVSQAVTTSTLGLSAATISVGQAEGLTVTIAGGVGSFPVGGTVNFFDTTAMSGLGTVAVTQTSGGGTAVLTVSNLAVGTHVLNARYSGDPNYLANTAANQTLVVTGKMQTITFAPIPDHTFGDPPFTLNATASSSLPVSYTVTAGPATVAGSVVTITGAGAVTIQATQAGNPTSYAAATPVTQSFIVSKAAQTITFPPIQNHVFGDAPFLLSATASSGLPVSYTVTSGPATVSGSTVTITGAGTVTIQATQAGNAAAYSAAASVTQSFTVAQPQTITFAAITNHTFGDAPFDLNATASSGLPVSYEVTSGPATVSGNVVTISGAGVVAIQATQVGSATFAAAIPVTQSFAVAKATQTIAFPPIPSHQVGDAPFMLNATTTSGLPVHYAVISGPATVVGNLVTITGAGTVQIQVTQAGNANFTAATPVNQAFTVSVPTQTISFPPIPNHVFGDAPFLLNATASSGLPVSFAVTGGPATVSGNTVTITGAGTVSIQAKQAGDGVSFAAASPVTQSFTIAKATQTITFPPIPNHAAGDAPFQLGATATSGLGVTYAVTSGPATIAGNVLTLTGAGTVQIQATQLGNANYSAATPITQSFIVLLQSQTITFPVIPNHTLGDAPFALSATASSKLTVTYSVVSGPASVVGSTVTLTGAGTVVIQAAQAGNAIYAAATPVTQSFNVPALTPILASIAPAGGIIGSGATTITLTGTNFVPTDTVKLNGAVIPTTFGSTTSLTAVIPASFVSAAGVGQVTVFDAASMITTPAQSFSVLAAPAIDFSGPATAPPASQPTLTFQLINPYPFPIAGSLNLSFTTSDSDGVDDPAVQFSAGGRTILYTIPALSQVTPTVQIQSGTVAGVATVTLVVTSNGVNVTPSDVAPLMITIPPAVPLITTATLMRSGNTLTVVVQGFSNTRELATASFHFNPAPGTSLTTPDITVPATSLFGQYFTSPASIPFGSTFVYTQNFNLTDNATSIESVVVTLVNTIGDSIQVTAQ